MIGFVYGSYRVALYTSTVYEYVDSQPTKYSTGTNHLGRQRGALALITPLALILIYDEYEYHTSPAHCISLRFTVCLVTNYGTTVRSHGALLYSRFTTLSPVAVPFLLLFTRFGRSETFPSARISTFPLNQSLYE